MLAKEDIEYIRYLHKEGYSIREIMKETDIPRTAVHNVVSQRADPEGIDLLHARIDELEKLVKLQGEQLQTLLPKPKKDLFEGVPQDLKLEAFRKRQRELAERAEYS
jgi:predicted DNA-binding protein YlxM (UPF0122 family)